MVQRCDILRRPNKSNMSQKNLVKIKCQETGQIIHTTRNKKNGDKKLELKKYNSTLRKHTTYKEVKK